MTRTRSAVVFEATTFALGAPAAIVHGGVDMEPIPSTYLSLDAAARAARSLLLNGASGVESAAAGVAVLEDDAAFNAGFGAVLTREGTVETDGAVAEGSTRRSAAVGAVPGLRNPAAVALHLMDRADVALLVGPAVWAFASDYGFAAEDLVTDEQRRSLAQVLEHGGASVFTGRRLPTETVGCIVVTDDGVSLASSTGGLVGKLPGRVGDASIPGAGFWADDRFGVLCSGSGEASIRRTTALVAADRIREHGLRDGLIRSVQEVADSASGSVTAIVAVDRLTGEVATAHCGSSFPVVVLGAGPVARLGVGDE